MAFVLVAEKGEDISVNAWNWRPTLELIREGKILSDDTCERLGIHGCSPSIDEQTALRIADHIDRKLATMQPETRLLFDLTVTATHKKKVTFSPNEMTQDVDLVDLYSTRYEWLVEFSAFCKKSGGFTVS